MHRSLPSCRDRGGVERTRGPCACPGCPFPYSRGRPILLIPEFGRQRSSVIRKIGLVSLCPVGIAKNKTLHHFIPQILVKLFPLEHLWLQRVVQNRVANESQVCFVTKNMIVESLLPELSPTNHLSAFVLPNPTHAGNRLIHAHHVTYCWPWNLLEGRDQMEDAVDVIRHHDKRLERQVRLTCRQWLPRFYKDVTQCRPSEKWLALPGTDGNEISARLAVVVPFQTASTAVMLFRILSHCFPLEARIRPPSEHLI